MGQVPSKAAPCNGAYPADQLLEYPKGSYTTTDRTKAAPLRAAKVGVASNDPNTGVPAMTLMALMGKAVKNHPDRTAMRVETGLAPPDMKAKTCPDSKPLSEWKSWTWKEYEAETMCVAKGLIANGLARYDGVNIYGFNSPEWFMGEMGAIFAGGIAAGIYPSDKPAQVAFKSKHSNSSCAVVEAKKHVECFAKIVEDVPALKTVVCWDPNFAGDALIESGITRKDGSKVKVMTWAQLIAEGKAADGKELTDRISKIEPGHACAYIYTSGTTGTPKAVMMTHDNLVFEATSCDMALGKFGLGGEDRIISYLPLSHVAGMLLDIIYPMTCTANHTTGWMSSNFARPYDLKILKIVERIKAIRPTLFLGVPRVWEKFAEKLAQIGAMLKAKGGLKPKISAWAKGKALYHQKNMALGGNGNTAWGHSLAGKILGQVKVKLGLDQMKFAMTGAAPIKIETLEYFGSLGIQINEVYGMSECGGACTMSTDVAHIWGSCGYPMPGVEVKIFKQGEGELVECPRAKDINKATEAEQGEICFRGRNNMMGYMANPVLGAEHVKTIEGKNKSAIDEFGWLHSGDKGCMGEHGFVKITGRYKELIITAGGENVAPVPIEDAVKQACPAISNIVMVGDKKKFNMALITLKAYGTGEEPGGEELEAAAQKFGCKTIGAAMRSDEYTDMIKNAIISINKNGDVCPSQASKIQKFTILPRDFSVTTEELTATLKTKRSVVAKMNKGAIDRCYAESVPKTQAYVTFAAELPAMGETASAADVKVEAKE